jgi:hypothetical protein
LAAAKREAQHSKEAICAVKPLQEKVWQRRRREVGIEPEFSSIYISSNS